MDDRPAAPEPEAGYRRRSARVLLLDPDGRTLLFEAWLDPRRPERGRCWFLPGGGVEPGETPGRAAARELHEETGLHVTPAELGDCVATTSGHADLGWAQGLFRDDLFLFRTPRVADIDVTGFEEAERAAIVGHRWWTAAQIAASPAPVFPLGLAELIEDVVAGRVPTTPRVLPWHHTGEEPSGGPLDGASP